MRRGVRGQGINANHHTYLTVFSNDYLIGSRDFIPRIDSNDEKPENCMLRPFLKMQAKKTPAMLAPEQPVFLTCKSLEDPSRSAVWFTRQRYNIFIKNLLIH